MFKNDTKKLKDKDMERVVGGNDDINVFEEPEILPLNSHDKKELKKDPSK